MKNLYIIIFLIPITIFAQSSKKFKTKGYFLTAHIGISHFDNTPNILSEQKNHIIFQGALGYQINEHFNVSAGIGMESNSTDFKIRKNGKDTLLETYVLPFTVDLRYNLFKKKLSPYLLFNYGFNYVYFYSDNYWDNDRFFKTGIGVKYQIKPQIVLYADISYWNSLFYSLKEAEGATLLIDTDKRIEVLREGVIFSLGVLVFANSAH